MTWRLANSLTTLREQVDKRSPHRDRASDGTIGDTAHASRVSDHNPNSHDVVQAWDCTHDPRGRSIRYRCSGRWLATRLRRHRDGRLKYVIWNGRMFSSYPIDGYPAWAWRPYTGADPHTNHVHISVQDEPRLYDNARPWKLGIRR